MYWCDFFITSIKIMWLEIVRFFKKSFSRVYFSNINKKDQNKKNREWGSNREKAASAVRTHCSACWWVVTVKRRSYDATSCGWKVPSAAGQFFLSQTERQQVPQVSVRFHEQGRQSHLVWFVGSGQVFFSAHYPRFSSRTYTRTVFTRFFQR
jgi:hypothetical protein